MNFLIHLFDRIAVRHKVPNSADHAIQQRVASARAAITAGNDADGEALLRDALRQEPGTIDALLALGELHSKRGADDQALACFEEVISVEPDCVPALRQSAQLHAKTQQWHLATELGRRILAIEPTDQPILKLVSVSARKSAQPVIAETALRTLLEKEPDSIWTLTELGWTLRDQGRYLEAEACLRRALKIKPDESSTCAALLTILRESGQQEEGSSLLRKFLDERPTDPSLLMALASEQKMQGQKEEAKRTYLRAVELEPTRVEPLVNLSDLMLGLGCHEEAIKFAERALALDPSSYLAHNNLALAALPLGWFEKGWYHYQWRFPILMRRPYPIPPVPGNPLVKRPSDFLPIDLNGRRVTLVEDQGLGDELSFLRFASMLRDRGAHVVYMPDPRIASMVARAGVVDRVAEADESAPSDTEIFLACGDMPLALKICQAEEIPEPIALRPLQERTEFLRQRLDSCGLTGRPLVGVTWRAGMRRLSGGSLFKEAPLESLGRLFCNLPVEVLILQRNPRREELEDINRLLGRKAHDFSDLNSDLESMLALVDLLDDYVTVSNTNVHLRAGTGKPARILVPNPADYRWMASGAKSPWFPRFSLYRQAVGGSWDEVFAQLSTDLARQFGNGGTVSTARPLVAAVELGKPRESRGAIVSNYTRPSYSRMAPSPRYLALIDLYRTMHTEGEKFLGIPPEHTFPGQSLLPQAERIKNLVVSTGARTILDYGSGKGKQYELRNISAGDGSSWQSIQAYWGVESIQCYDPSFLAFSTLPDSRFDGVISTDVLEHCPEEDIPWILGELFSFAEKFVFANVACYPARKKLPTGENAHCTIRPASWWETMLWMEATKHPGIMWEFWIQSIDVASGRIIEQRIGSN